MARRSAPAPDRKKHGRRQLGEEQRRQLSERAKALHASGKLNAKRDGAKGGRPRKPRASEVVSAAAERHADEIVAALRAGVREGAPEARSRSAERWLAAAQREDALKLKADDHEQKARRDLSREQIALNLGRCT